MNQESSFGRYVRQRRRELDLTQEELARRVGCAAITIRKIEADDARPSVQIAERLAMALAIPLDDRAEFVRRAREARPEPVEIVTPMPALEEIGHDDLTGRAIRGYALAEKIGKGGMGAVYRAVQPLVEREVAIKIILPAYANHPDFIRRFEAEAQLVARLEHPHIVPLYDYWREPGIAYLVMRLLRGGSVSALLKEGALPIETTSRMLEQICTALHAAHRIGVIHRDLKPANVLLDEDQNAYLADFGIAKNLGNPNLEDQTQVDMIVGSPAYFSPEQIQSASIRPQTDIYALGIMLYELLTGSLPFTGPTPFDLIQQHIDAPMPPLAARCEGLPAALDAVICRAAAKNPLERYPDVLKLLDDFRRAISGMALQPISVPGEEEAALDLINPYKGLRAFGEADADDYFGREALIQQLLARLGEGGDLARFLAVVGPSGSGKSSAVGAGLVPALRRGGLVGSENWFIINFLPGAHPFEELEAALLRVAVNPPESLLSQLKDGERGLLRAVRRVLPADESVGLVLVIDQFEEVFTLVTDEAERALFLSSLVTTVLDERSRVRVVITLRADFTDRPLRYVDFGELLQRRSEFVLPLTPDEVERAIVGPARRAGLRLEPGLVSTMMREVSDQPGALPLLEYALTELFEKREGRTLTKAAYDSIGGVLAALGRRAEEVYLGLSEVDQFAARQLFLRLVTLGEGVEDTRRRVLRSELATLTPNPSPSRSAPSEARSQGEGSGASPSPQRGDPLKGAGGWGEGGISTVIDAFGKHRLLTFDRDPISRGPTVEVAHEALLREWPRLREWLRNSRADVRMQRQLAAAAQDWHNAHCEVSFLLTGARLAQFEAWAQSSDVALTRDERAFLDASLAEREKREAEEAARQQRELGAERQTTMRLRRRNRMIAVTGGVSLLLAVLAGMFGVQSSQNERHAQQQARLAFSRQLAAQSLSRLDDRFDRALLLAAAASQVESTSEAQNGLLSALQHSPLLEVILHGHASAVSSVAFSPGCASLPGAGAEQCTRILASGSDGGTIILWDVTNPQAPKQLGEPLTSRTNQVLSVAFSPDGKTLASGHADGTIIQWDVTNPLAAAQLGAPLTGHTDFVDTVAFSPDGTTLASGSDDGTIVLWDVANLRNPMQLGTPLDGHSDRILSVAFSPDGKTLASASMVGPIYLWDVTNPYRPTQLGVLAGHAHCAASLAFSPDGHTLASGSWDKTIILWDVTNPRAATQLAGPFTSHTDYVNSVAFSPDGKTLASASADKTIVLWDVANPSAPTQLDTPLIGHTSAVPSVAFNPDGKTLASASADKTIVLWDVTNPHVPTQLGRPLTGHTDRVSSVAFSPDCASPSEAGAERCGKTLASGSGDGTIILWDVANPYTPTQLSEPFVNHRGGVWSVAFNLECASSRGVGAERCDKLLASGNDDGTISLWDVTNPRAPTQLSAPDTGHTRSVFSVAFSPGGKTLASGSGDSTIILWDVTNPSAPAQLGAPLTGHTKGLFSIAFSPDGKTLASAGADKAIILWDLTNPRAPAQLGAPLTGHIDQVVSVAFTPDGKTLASGSADKTIILWDVTDPRAPKQWGAPLTGHTDRVNHVAFSADGRILASGSGDGTIILWDVTNPRAPTQLDAPLTGHSSWVLSVAFSPDGKTLASGSADKTVMLWDVDLKSWQSRACQIAGRNFTRAEWLQYFGDDAYRKTCEQWPLQDE